MCAPRSAIVSLTGPQRVTPDQNDVDCCGPEWSAGYRYGYPKRQDCAPIRHPQNTGVPECAPQLLRRRTGCFESLEATHGQPQGNGKCSNHEEVNEVGPVLHVMSVVHEIQRKT